MARQACGSHRTWFACPSHVAQVDGDDFLRRRGRREGDGPTTRQLVHRDAAMVATCDSHGQAMCRRRWLRGMCTTCLLSVDGVARAREPASKTSAVDDRGYGPKFVKRADGLAVQDLTPGVGVEAQLGDRIVFDYVCRRANGYFVYGTVEGVGFQPLDVATEPETAVLGNDELIPGLERGLLGLRRGGKRRLVVPPALGFVRDGLRPRPPNYGARRQIAVHVKEPFLFEVSVLDVKKADPHGTYLG
mmetsp:Transcript_9929/g.60626  ORF Transcript_9929/g.60626 Transcript_9929/m.60626 type:complete len:246 (-) Transcript_9929:2189-2926(-)